MATNGGLRGSSNGWAWKQQSGLAGDRGRTKKVPDTFFPFFPGHPLPFRTDGDLPLDELVNQARDQALIRDTLLGRLPLDASEVVIR